MEVGSIISQGRDGKYLQFPCYGIHQLAYVLPTVDLFGGEADLEVLFNTYYQLDVVERIPVFYIGGNGGIGKDDIVVIQHILKNFGYVFYNFLSFQSFYFLLIKHFFSSYLATSNSQW
jgi:hypothetical protein